MENLREILERLNEGDSDYEDYRRINITDGVVNKTYMLGEILDEAALDEDVVMLLDEPITEFFGVGKCLYVEIK